jgi:hypothetical protein
MLPFEDRVLEIRIHNKNYETKDYKFITLEGGETKDINDILNWQVKKIYSPVTNKTYEEINFKWFENKKIPKGENTKIKVKISIHKNFTEGDIYFTEYDPDLGFCIRDDEGALWDIEDLQEFSKIHYEIL